MDRLTLGDCIDEVAEATGLCSTTGRARIIGFVNESQRRLLRRGKWLGSVKRYRITVSDALVTWPRSILGIEAVAFCNSPGNIRNGWHEYLGYGLGQRNADSSSYKQLIDRGMAPIFTDITAGATNRKVRVYADVIEGAGLYITFQGYDENANWIRTQDGAGNWLDGEQVPIPTDPGTPILSTKKFTSITAVLKPVTNGSLRVYEYRTDTTTNVQQIAYYEPDETRPVYRRSLLPGALNTGTCSCGSNPAQRYVTVAVKLRHIPVVNNNDWLILGNLDAIKIGAVARLKEKKDLFAEAQQFWAQAVSELEKELREYEGDGVLVSPRFAEEFGSGSIPCLI